MKNTREILEKCETLSSLLKSTIIQINHDTRTDCTVFKNAQNSIGWP